MNESGAMRATDPAPALSALGSGQGVMPLDYLLSVMRDEAEEPGMRIAAARAALSYLHPKWQPVSKDDASEQTHRIYEIRRTSVRPEDR